MGERILRCVLGALALGLLCGAGPAVEHEDLAGIKLPNGVLTVPEANAAPDDQGYVVRFSDQRFCRIGSDADPLETPKQSYERMQRNGDGDLIYSKINQGSFLILSGRVMDLGPHLLADYIKFALPAPRVTKDNTISHIQEGSVYLVQATNSNYVLVRVLHKTDSAVTLQYIYQPDGGLDFSAVHATVPAQAAAPTAAMAPTQGTQTLVVAPSAGAGGISPSHAPAPSVPGMTIAPLTQSPGGAIPSLGPPPATPTLTPITPVRSLGPPPGPTVLMPYLDTYLRQRAELIADRIRIVRDPARSAAQIQAKAMAMDDLRQLHATEAIDVLIDEISFLNPHATPSDQFSMEAFHPALGVLKSLGKPASLAALKAIGTLSLGADRALPESDATETPAYKLHLLVQVVAGVEGPDVAVFLLRQQEAKADATHRINYETALKDLGQ